MIGSKRAQYPWSTTIVLKPENDTHVSFSYAIEINAPESEVALIKAWKTGQEGSVLLPLPSPDQVKAANQSLREDPEMAVIRSERTQKPVAK